MSRNLLLANNNHNKRGGENTHLTHLLPNKATPPSFFPVLRTGKHLSSDIFKDRQIDRLLRQTPYGGPLVPPVRFP